MKRGGCVKVAMCSWEEQQVYDEGGVWQSWEMLVPHSVTWASCTVSPFSSLDLAWACIVWSIWNNVRNGLSTVLGPIRFNWCGHLLHCGQKEVGLKVLDSRNGRKCKGVVSDELQKQMLKLGRGAITKRGAGVIRQQSAWLLKTFSPFT